jgi:hypothetical protein
MWIEVLITALLLTEARPFSWRELERNAPYCLGETFKKAMYIRKAFSSKFLRSDATRPTPNVWTESANKSRVVGSPSRKSQNK